MKLPFSWLKKYIDVTLSAEKLAELLTLSGNKVEAVHGQGPDSVLEIEVTTNRPDTLSILGMAYETGAVTGKKVKMPAAYTGSSPKSFIGDRFDSRFRGNDKTGISVEDKKACPRYTARVIQNVRVAPSPQEIQKLLSLAGTRAISNIVDVTNFVLYECGQPMHAFDLDKIKGNQIIVRRAREGEKFLALYGVEYILNKNTLVVADEARPIAIAGVIGGKLTEVTPSTKNILLESAYFDPALVRQASKKYKISTESSYRFERGVQWDQIDKASLRATQLIQEWAGGEDVSGLIDKSFAQAPKLKPVALRLSQVQDLLGLKISLTRVEAIFKSLSFSVKKSSGGKLLVTPSAARRDISIEADLLEEILRIEGFDKTPERLPVARYFAARFVDRKA